MDYDEKSHLEKDNTKWVPMKKESDWQKALNGIAGVIGILGLGFGACLFFSFQTVIVLALCRICGCAPSE